LTPPCKLAFYITMQDELASPICLPAAEK